MSSNAIATEVDAVLETTTLPVMALRSFLFDDLGLAGGVVTASGQTQIDITNNTHPITTGLNIGTLTVLTSSGGLGAGLAPVGDVVGTVVGDTNRGTIIALDQGDPLSGGGTAPGRRVGFFAINALPNKLNTAGWDLFDRSLAWTIEPAQTGGGGTPTVTDELHWVITDHLGTPTVTTTQTGTVVHDNRRYPYGTVRQTTGTEVTDIDFTAQTKDPGTGLIDYNARHYDPLVGRFVAADSIVVDGTNRYSYVRNSPTNATDPSGHCTVLNGNLHCGRNSTNYGSRGSGYDYISGQEIFQLRRRDGTARRDSWNAQDRGCSYQNGECGFGTGVLMGAIKAVASPLFLATSIADDPGGTLKAAVSPSTYVDAVRGCFSSGQGFGECVGGTVFPGSKVRGRRSAAPRTSSWVDDAATSKVPSGWGAGRPNNKGVGTRWVDPANPQANGIRIDQGNPASSLTTQQVDHVVVRSGGRVIGRDGNPISGSIRDNYEMAHIPLDEWLTWSTWNAP